MKKILPFILIAIGLGGLAIADPDHNRALPPITVKQAGFNLSAPDIFRPQKVNGFPAIKMLD